MPRGDKSSYTGKRPKAARSAAARKAAGMRKRRTAR